MAGRRFITKNEDPRRSGSGSGQVVLRDVRGSPRRRDKRSQARAVVFFAASFACAASFAKAAADERIFQRGVDRLFRGAIQLALVGVVTLRQPQQLLPLGTADCSSLYTRH